MRSCPISLQLEAAEKFRPELLTIDVAMPGESGLNVLPHLRAMLPKAIIFVISSTTTPLYKEVAFARGADAYIEKGRVFSTLANVVASARERGNDQAGSHL